MADGSGEDVMKKMISIDYDLFYDGMSSVYISVDSVSKNNKEYWLEDTTENIWEDYPVALTAFKEKKYYGKDVIIFETGELDISWLNFIIKVFTQ